MASEPTAQPTPTFFAPLEACRGIAAMLVVLFHASQATVLHEGELRPLYSVKFGTPSPIEHAIDAVYGALLSLNSPINLSVEFFFILSGFVLTAALSRSWQGPTSANLARFALGRLFRLFPPIWSALLCFWAFFLVSGLSVAPEDQFRPLTLLFNAILFSVSIDGVMWSLQTEVLALPLIVGLFWAYRRWGLWTNVVATMLFIGLFFNKSWVHAMELPGGPARVQWIYAFCLGALSFHLGARLARLRSAGMVPSLVLLGLFQFLPSVSTKPLALILSAIAGAGFIAVLAFQPKNPMSRILEHGAFRILGRVSYSLYLLHMLVLTYFWLVPEKLMAVLAFGVPPLVLALALFSFTMLISLPLAWANQALIEGPAIRLGKLTWQKAMQAHRSSP